MLVLLHMHSWHWYTEYTRHLDHCICWNILLSFAESETIVLKSKFDFSIFINQERFCACYLAMNIWKCQRFINKEKEKDLHNRLNSDIFHIWSTERQEHSVPFINAVCDWTSWKHLFFCKENQPIWLFSIFIHGWCRLFSIEGHNIAWISVFLQDGFEYNVCLISTTAVNIKSGICTGTETALILPPSRKL